MGAQTIPNFSADKRCKPSKKMLWISGVSLLSPVKKLQQKLFKTTISRHLFNENYQNYFCSTQLVGATGKCNNLGRVEKLVDG